MVCERERDEGRGYALGVLIPRLLERGADPQAVLQFAVRFEAEGGSSPFKEGVLLALREWGQREVGEEARRGALDAMRRLGYLG